VAHVPNSFPTDVPSSDPVIPSDMDLDSEDEDFDPNDSNGNMELDKSQSMTLDGVDHEYHEHEDQLEDEELPPSQMKPLSGLIALLTSIKDNVIHMTCSATARLNLFMVAPPKVVSIEEDCMLSLDAMLNELRSLRQHLMGAYQTLGRALAQLSASNAHCTTIWQELDHVHQQLQNVMKKKERGSKKIKARFLTARGLQAEFEQEDAEQQEQEHVTAEKNKQKEAMNAESA
jgi:septal ring factor EnvC (AmiA/AmiB activator)